MVLEVYPLSVPKPIPWFMPSKRAHIRAIILRCAIYIICKFSRSFATDLKRLPDLLCMGPNTPLSTQVSVSLVPYKLIVSYYYFPF